MTAATLGTLDGAIIAIYFLAVLAIGLVVAFKTRTGDDLFLAGRSLNYGVIGFSLFASNISSTTLIGLAGDAYKSGLAVANYEWMAGVVLALMAVFVIPLYLRTRITTIPEYLEQRFDRRSRLYFSAITIFLSIMVDTAGGLYAGALVLKTFFPDLVVWQTCAVLALVAGVYTAAGGLKAVVYTDVIQAIVLIVGCTVLAVIVFGRLDYDWGKVTASLPAGHLSLLRPLDDPLLPWLGTLIGVPVLGFYYWATNQYIVQRVLGARSVEHARWGANLGGLLKLLPLFIMVLPGAMASLIYPDLPNKDMVFPVLVTRLLPPGLMGLVLAGLIAAIMSSIDSTLNSASTLIVCDFLTPSGGKLEPKQVARYGRITTVVLMVVAAAWAPMIGNFQGLFSYIQQAFSYIVPPVVAVFVIGIFWRGGGARAAFRTLIVGHLICGAVFVMTLSGALKLHFTVIAGLLTLGSMALFTSFAWLGKPEGAPSPESLWSPQLARAGAPGLADYRLQAGVVLLLTVVMLVLFR
jgi:SSS family solute:Na+ symporter